jgi:DNA topoisomerase II
MSNINVLSIQRHFSEERIIPLWRGISTGLRWNSNSSINRAFSSLEAEDEDSLPDDHTGVQQTEPIQAQLVSTADTNTVEEHSNNEEQERYSRKTPLEHILLRPGMYIGSTERGPPTPSWVISPTIPPPPPASLDNETHTDTIDSQSQPFNTSLHSLHSLEQPLQLVPHETCTVPALLKVFDEILVNASDHRFYRSETTTTTNSAKKKKSSHNKCTRIDVTIDPGSDTHPPCLVVRNNGPGIPVRFYKDEDLYVPTLLFGHLMTGSNFDDDEKRITGGRHGYGAKLTNIFARTFTVETMDAQRRLGFRQTWQDNMKDAQDPVLWELPKSFKPQDEYTMVSFVPDLPRLTSDPEARTLTPDDYAWLCKRVVDIAGCAAGELQVTLNGYDVSMPSFREYVQLYRSPTTAVTTRDEKDISASPPLCVTSVNPRWQIAVGLSHPSPGKGGTSSFESISFVNGMCTSRGGMHVQVVVQQIVRKLQERALKMEPDLAEYLTAGLIRNALFVAVNALIENPSFDSQMKEYLTTSPSHFGSSYELPDSFAKDLIHPVENGGPGILEAILQRAYSRQQSSMLKSWKGSANAKSSRHLLLSIPKLEDAHQAGGPNSPDCTLILTEGDSAKALAVAGLEVVGRATFGVFPLRGKFLNVRVASVHQLETNAEVKALRAILGLDLENEYDTVEDRKTLRYGRVMIMADQDTGTSNMNVYIYLA